MDKSFKTPRQAIPVSEDSETTIEEEEQDLTEMFVKDEVQHWLAIHGKALFSLECSKFLVAERKRENFLKICRK